MIAGIENIFKCYANNVFKDDPKNLTELPIVIERYFPEVADRLQSFVKRILFFYEYHDPKVIYEFRDYVKKKKPETFKDPFWLSYFEVAVEAVYGFRDGYCESICFWRDFRREKLEKSLFEGENRLYCIDCDQLFFISMLKQIVKGEKYRNIEGLAVFLDEGQHAIKHHVAFHKKSDQIKSTKLLSIDFGRRVLMGGRFKDYKHKFVFQDNLNRVISLSLGEFLLKNDRNRDPRDKLYQCQWCEGFFIGGSYRKRKYCDKCSSKSKKTREEWREYQKTRRKIKSEEISKARFVQKIENLMKDLDASRQEAVELIQYDESI